MARRQGRAGVFWGTRAGVGEAPKLELNPVFLWGASQTLVFVPSSRRGVREDGAVCVWLYYATHVYTYVGRFRFPSSLSMKPSTSTRSRRAFGSVVLTVPASHISVRSWATTS